MTTHFLDQGQSWLARGPNLAKGSTVTQPQATSLDSPRVLARLSATELNCSTAPVKKALPEGTLKKILPESVTKVADLTFYEATSLP